MVAFPLPSAGEEALEVDAVGAGMDYGMGQGVVEADNLKCLAHSSDRWRAIDGKLLLRAIVVRRGSPSGG